MSKPRLGGLFGTGRDTCPWVGGPPLADWSSPAEGFMNVLSLRPLEIVFVIKGHTKRTEGLTTSFEEFCFSCQAPYGRYWYGYNLLHAWRKQERPYGLELEIFTYFSRFTKSKVEQPSLRLSSIFRIASMIARSMLISSWLSQDPQSGSRICSIPVCCPLCIAN